MTDINPNKSIEPTAATKPAPKVAANSNQPLPAATASATNRQTLLVNQVLTTLPASQDNLLQLDQNGRYFIEAKDQAGKSLWFRSNTPWPNSTLLQVTLPKSGSQKIALEQIVELPNAQQQLQKLNRLLQASQPQQSELGQVLKSLPIPHLKASIPLGEGGNRLLPILLNHANQVFWLNTDQTITPGQAISFYLGKQGIHLQALPFQQTQWLSLNQTLQQSVSNSLPIHQVLKQLAYFVKHTQQLPVTIPKAANRLLAQLPTLNQLSNPTQLRQWLKDSGLFFEQTLTKQANTGQLSLSKHQDLKASLLQLIKLFNQYGNSTSAATSHTKPPSWAQLYQTSPQPLSYLFPWLTTTPAKNHSPLEITSLLKQAVYRLQSNQLISLQPTLASPTADAPVIQQWQLEIPLFVQGQWQSIQLELQKQHGQPKEQTANETETLWQFQLSFDLPPIGPLYARVKLQGNTASATFWADQPATCNAISEHLEELRDALNERGIEIDSLSCQQGAPARQNTFIEQHLIDITT